MIKVIPWPGLNRIRMTGALALFLGMVGCAGGCAGSRVVPTQELAFEAAEKPAEVQELWTRKVKGFITDLAVARSGNSLLVGTIPDYDQDKHPREFVVSLLDSSDGDPIWEKPQKAQVRALDVSEDGSLAVVANYAGELVAFDRSGKEVWNTPGVCRPIVLSRLKKVLCYHDDDAEPLIAFDVLDWDGKKSYSHSIKDDILALKVADDQQHLVIGLTGGQVILLNSEFKTVWKRKLDGEILDLGISSGPEPKVVALTIRKGQKLWLLGADGKTLSESAPDAHIEQIELSPDANGLYAHGNGPRGQFLVSYAGEGLAQRWRKTDPRYADYSTAMIVSNELAVIGMESLKEKKRESFLIAFDPQGKLKAAIRLETDEGAYLYAQGYSAQNAFLAIGTDDGQLHGLRMFP